MSTIHEQKTALRKKLLAERHEIPSEQKQAWDAALLRHTIETEFFQTTSLLLLYAPIGDEPRLLPLAQEAWRRGKQVAFPISHKQTHTLTFHTVASLSELNEGTYGIFEPPADAPTVESTRGALCIVPALAFDRAGYRLGYGGGYYDRLLAALEGHTLGLCYHQLLQPSLPRGEYDQAVELIITEKGRLYPDETTKKES